MSVWSKEHNPETSIKRNVFPQSFTNNLTLNFGKIIPFAVIPTMSGDTWNLSTAFGLRFWPTAWPLQNNIRADVHWFYVRSRNLYNEYKEWYTGGNVDKPMPYLSNLKSEDFKNGSLMDYMNVPTVIHLSAGDTISESFSNASQYYNVSDSVLYDNRPLSSVDNPYPTMTGVSSLLSYSHTDGSWTVLKEDGTVGFTVRKTVNIRLNYDLPSYYFGKTIQFEKDYKFFVPVGDGATTYNMLALPCVFISYNGDYYPYPAGDEVSYWSSITFKIPTATEAVDFVTSISGGAPLPENVRMQLGHVLLPREVVTYADTLVCAYPPTSAVYSRESMQLNLSDFPASVNPFMGANPKIALNALPFRAYEQIYNAFFRDERNNPLVIGGKTYYDKYLPTTDGGADSTHYDLHVRNWEQDFLTTALPSPQQGEAPLVGISATGVMSISDDDGNVYHAQAITADDNDTIVGAKFIKTNQDGTSIPNSVARSLVSYATSGISINDFRNVNALQRYLETNLRRGLKYRDLVAARWGVNISYAEMNMPEFIGGATEYVTPSQVNQKSENTADNPLGSFAGQLHCQGSQKHKIRHFCDEDGFIIGVISVVPVPIYSQLLPKMFTKFDPLDFFQPEFGHIGMQPIPMKEVAPLQVALNNGNQDETFGYQRAWYDYLGRVDEVHGQMRGSLRDYVMYRTFSGIPRLGTDFLLVDNKPLDNVFMVQKDADGNSVDKIMGQIYVDAVAKRPIPRFGTPRLE